MSDCLQSQSHANTTGIFVFTHKYPSSIVSHRQFETVHEALINLRSRYPVSLGSVNNELLLILGEKPLLTTSPGAG
jgi:hypothetical protein